MFLTGGDVPGQPAVFIRRSVYEAVGPLRADVHYTLDFEYWLRISLRYSMERMRLMHEPLAVVRQWPGSKTLTGVQAIGDEHRRILDGYFAGGGLPPELQARRAEAYAGTWWKQASLEWQAGQGAQARASAREAGRLAPQVYPRQRVRRFALVSRLPYRHSRLARPRLGASARAAARRLGGAARMTATPRSHCLWITMPAEIDRHAQRGAASYQSLLAPYPLPLPFHVRHLRHRSR